MRRLIIGLDENMHSPKHLAQFCVVRSERRSVDDAPEAVRPFDEASAVVLYRPPLVLGRWATSNSNSTQLSMGAGRLRHAKSTN